jgi:hypothetical protein
MGWGRGMWDHGRGGEGNEEAAGEICIFMLTYIYVGGGIFLSLPPSILSCPAFIYVS